MEHAAMKLWAAVLLLSLTSCTSNADEATLDQVENQIRQHICSLSEAAESYFLLQPEHISFRVARTYILRGLDAGMIRLTNDELGTGTTIYVSPFDAADQASSKERKVSFGGVPASLSVAQGRIAPTQVIQASVQDGRSVVTITSTNIDAVSDFLLCASVVD